MNGVGVRLWVENEVDVEAEGKEVETRGGKKEEIDRTGCTLHSTGLSLTQILSCVYDATSRINITGAHFLYGCRSFILLGGVSHCLYDKN